MKKVSFLLAALLFPKILFSTLQAETITVAKALEIGQALELKKTTDVQYTIRGYVSTIASEFNEQYGTQAFYITDDISTAAYSAQTSGFQIYRGKPSDGKPIKGGAFVEVTAKIYRYTETIIENYEQNITVTILKEAPECRTFVGVCGENVRWTLDCHGSLVISGTGATRDYLKNESPWKYLDVNTVTIENGVTSLGKYFFYGCPAVTINIPASVTKVAFNTFNVTYMLLNFVVDPQNTVFSSREGVLYSKSGLSVIRYPRGRKGGYAIPDGVTTIVDGAFNGCVDMTAISMPGSVKKIGYAAFYACNLTSVTIPSAVEKIDSLAFAKCPLTSVINYAAEPQEIDTLVFLDVDLSKCTLSVLQTSLAAYQTAKVWKKFGRIEGVGAQPVEDAEEQVVVTPTNSSVEITWPAVTNAATYELIIKDKQGKTICTLIFNEQGVLQSIAFHAPANNAEQQTQTDGFSFTVTGLESGKVYDLTIVAKDHSDYIVDEKKLSFITPANPIPITAIDQINQQSTINNQKLMINGQLFIQRGDEIFNAQGTRVK